MKSAREGYKMTELGEIPKDWSIKTINDLIKENIIIDVMDGNHGEIHPKASEYVDIGIPFIMANNLKNGKLDIEGCKFISYEQAKRLRKGFSVEGDVLLTHKGTLGETAIVPKLRDEYIMLTPQVTYYRVSNNNVLINRYLKVYFDSKKYQDKLKSFGSQSTRDYVGITEQRKLSIILPTIEEQEKIASIISTVDEQIDNVDALIEKNKELKKGLMQTLLTKGIGHTKFKKTEIGEIPEEWNIFKLSDCATIIDSLHETPEYSESGFPMIRVVDVNGKAINTKLTNKVCETIYKKFTKKYEPKQGDIIMSRVGSYGLVSYLKDSERVCLGQNIVIITTELCKKYLFYVLSSEYVKNNIEKVTVGSSQKTLSLANINELKILIPSIKEQNKISLILSDIDEKIEKYENKKQKLEELKKGLMQQLLSGQIRVNID